MRGYSQASTQDFGGGGGGIEGLDLLTAFDIYIYI